MGDAVSAAVADIKNVRKHQKAKEAQLRREAISNAEREVIRAAKLWHCGEGVCVGYHRELFAAVHRLKELEVGDG